MIPEENEKLENIGESFLQSFEQARPTSSIKDWDQDYTPIYQQLEIELKQKSPIMGESVRDKRTHNKSELSGSSFRLNTPTFSERSKLATSRGSFRSINLNLTKSTGYKTAKDIAFEFPNEKVLFTSRFALSHAHSL